MRTHNLDKETISQIMPKFKEQKNGLDKLRANAVPNHINEIELIEITGEYMLTNGQKLFLQYDNKMRSNRIMIFYTEQSFEILMNSVDWFNDAAFKICSKTFMQLCVLSCIHNNLPVECVFVLSQNRDYQTYKEIFGVVKSKAQFQNNVGNFFMVRTVLCDLESAAARAIKFHFGHVEIKGCWFHLCQIIYMKAIKIIGQEKVNRIKYRNWIARFSALALVPLDKLSDACEIIKNSCPDEECKPMIVYFENQWINKINPNLWNHFGTFRHRVNTLTEEHHSKYNKMLRINHRGVIGLVSFLKDLEEASIVHPKALAKKSKKMETAPSKIDLSKEEFERNVIDFATFYDKMCHQVLFPFSSGIHATQDGSNDDQVYLTEFEQLSDSLNVIKLECLDIDNIVQKVEFDDYLDNILAQPNYSISSVNYLNEIGSPLDQVMPSTCSLKRKRESSCEIISDDEFSNQRQHHNPYSI